MAAYVMAYASVFRRALGQGLHGWREVFRNGRNQAIRIPREFAVRDLEIRRQRDSLILSARPRDWSGLQGVKSRGYR
jgi:hypothetical protein